MGPPFRHFHRPPQAVLGLVIWILALILFSPAPACPLSADPGDTFVWELRNTRSATGYVKGVYLGITGGDVYINYTSYDILGDQEIYIPNKSAGYFWEDPAKFGGWQASGYATANITQLDQTFFCVIRVRYYDFVNTSDYYDIESGILVKSESDNGESMDIISIGNLEIKAYVDSQGPAIPGFSGLLVGLVVALSVAFLVLRRHLRPKAPLRSAGA